MDDDDPPPPPNPISEETEQDLENIVRALRMSLSGPSSFDEALARLEDDESPDLDDSG